MKEKRGGCVEREGEDPRLRGLILAGCHLVTDVGLR